MMEASALQCCRTGILISGFIRPIHKKCVIFDLIGLINSFYWIKDASLDWESINFSNESEIVERKNRNKLYLLSKLLDEDILNDRKLKHLSWKGIPSSIRPSIWKILLRYTPKKLSRRNKQLRNKRYEYYDLRKRYFDTAIFDIDQQKLLKWTELDIKRMRYNYSNNEMLKNQKIQELLKRILFLFRLKHPYIEYSHAILDILIIITVAFVPNYRVNDVSYINWNVIEPDCYQCLENLFASKQLFNNYTYDLSGTLSMLNALKWIIKKVNITLYSHFESERVNFNQFWQWIHNFLIGKMEINHVIKVWDAMLCTDDDEFNSFHVSVCSALLLSYSSLLLTLDFTQIASFIQTISSHTEIWTTNDIDTLLAEAFKIHELFKQNLKLMIKSSVNTK